MEKLKEKLDANNFIPFGTDLFFLEQFYSIWNKFILFGTILFFLTKLPKKKKNKNKNKIIKM